MNRTAVSRTAMVTLGVAGLYALSRALSRAQRIAMTGRSVLIVGGSRGLGLAMAREFGRLGARVVLAARDAAELDVALQDLRVRGIQASAHVCDISNGAAATQLVETAAAECGGLDILVNNAGVIEVGPIEHMQKADFEKAMATHFWGPWHTMAAAIPIMRRQGVGRIVNISSIGGRVAVPHLAPYCASKFALTGLSTSLRAELLKDNIHVTTVSPGLMRTGSPFNAWFKGRYRNEFTWFAVADSMPLLTVSAARAARLVVDACRNGDPDLVIGWPAKLMVIANAAAPRAVAFGMSLATAVLPRPLSTEQREEHARSGWQSGSRWAPSRLTSLTERAAVTHNQLPHVPHRPQ